jgi:hypothetical protein
MFKTSRPISFWQCELILTSAIVTTGGENASTGPDIFSGLGAFICIGHTIGEKANDIFCTHHRIGSRRFPVGCHDIDPNDFTDAGDGSKKSTKIPERARSRTRFNTFFVPMFVCIKGAEHNVPGHWISIDALRILKISYK